MGIGNWDWETGDSESQNDGDDRPLMSSNSAASLFVCLFVCYGAVDRFLLAADYLEY
jgi:hypothetical protein